MNSFAMDSFFAFWREWLKATVFLFFAVTSGAARSEAQLLIGYVYLSQSGEVRIPETGCRLKLKQKGTGKTVFLSLPPRQSHVRGDLAPGEWMVERLGCGLGKVWDLDGLLPTGIKVRSDGINTIGKLILEIPKVSLVRRSGETKDDTPSQVRMAPRGESLSWLEASFGGEASIGSAFSGKSLSGLLVEPDEAKDSASREGPLGRDGFRLELLGLKGGETRARELVAPLQAQLLVCSERENQFDPLRLGRIVWSVKYQAGRPQGASEIVSRHAFRDEFVNCLKKALSEVSLGREDVELRVSY